MRRSKGSEVSFSAKELAREKWCDVPGFDNIEVSDLGRCRKNGVTILRPHIDGCLFTTQSGESRYLNVKRAVFEIFNGKKIDHHISNIDGNLYNLRLSNLKLRNRKGRRHKFKIVTIGKEEMVASFEMRKVDSKGDLVDSLAAEIEGRISYSTSFKFPPFYIELIEGDLVLSEFVKGELEPRFYVLPESEIK